MPCIKTSIADPMKFVTIDKIKPGQLFMTPDSKCVRYKTCDGAIIFGESQIAHEKSDYFNCDNYYIVTSPVTITIEPNRSETL